MWGLWRTAKYSLRGETTQEVPAYFHSPYAFPEWTLRFCDCGQQNLKCELQKATSLFSLFTSCILWRLLPRALECMLLLRSQVLTSLGVCPFANAMCWICLHNVKTLWKEHAATSAEQCILFIRAIQGMRWQVLCFLAIFRRNFYLLQTTAMFLHPRV